MAHDHISSFRELPARLAAAVGLDPNNTQAFTIEVFPDELIRVRSNQITTAGGIEEVASIFRGAAEEGRVPEIRPRPFIPVARFEDIRARAAAGALTNAERLALAVLAGGRDGEEGVPALIDAAQEEYSHGSYRVPVRIVADKARLKLIITPHPQVRNWTQSQWETITRDLTRNLRDWYEGKTPVLMLAPGWSVQPIEFDGVGPQVEITIPPTADGD